MLVLAPMSGSKAGMNIPSDERSLEELLRGAIRLKQASRQTELSCVPWDKNCWEPLAS